MSAGVGSKYYSGFNPLDIGNCALWLDAADPSTITLSGSNVTQWNDKSGNSNNATQTTAARQPTYSNNAVSFVSANQNFLSLPNGTFFTSPTTSSSIFLVMTPTSRYNLNVFLFQGNVSTNLAIGLYLDGTQFADYWQTVGSSTWSSYTVGRPYLYSYIFSSNSTNISSFIDGSGGVLRGQPNYSVALTNATLGAEVERGFYSDMTIREVIVYRGLELSAWQRQQIESYLAWKWGLRTNLPTTHPYYFIIPVTRPFVPIDFTGCALWYDGADKSTMTLSGNTLMTWSNKAGTTVPITTSGTAATVVDSFTSGFSYINVPFGGELRFTTALSSQARSWFFVVRNNTPAANWTFMQLLHPSTATTGQDQIYIGRSGSSYTLFQQPRNTVRVSATVRDPVGVTNIYTVINSTATSNNTINTTGTVNTLSTSLTATGYATGSLLYAINQAATTNYQTSLDIFEILFYTRDLTIRERQQVEGYLARKWGLQGLSPTLTLFTPLQISGCQLWLDGADTTTITFGSGSNVSQWNDKSGNGYNATQATSGNRPVYVTASNRLSFTPASSQFLNLPTNALPAGNSSYTYFVVCSITSQTGRTLIAGGTFGTTNATFGLRSDNTGGGLRHYWGANDQTTAANAYTVNQTFIAQATYTSGGTRATLVNGTQLASDTPGTRIQATSPNYIGVGSNASLEFLGGTISEILVYNTALTTTDRQQVEGYLARKWGLAGGLPATNPYALRSLPSTHPFISRLPGTVSFNPRQISNCALWLDAGDPATLTLSGSNVTQWNDKSGNGRNTSTLFRAPTFANGSVRFNNQGLSVNLSASTNVESGFFVAGFTNHNQGNTLIGAANGGGGRQFRVGTNTATIQTLRQDIAGVLISGAAVPTATTVMVEYVNNGSVLTHYLNGGTYASGTAAAYTAGLTSSIGQRFGDASSEALVGYINEIIVYSVALTDTERQQVEGYLAWKWGLQGPSSYITTTTTNTITNPTQISGCALWLDATDNTSFTFSSGSNISQWRDKTSNVYVGTGVNSPTLVSGSLNGYASVNFNGTTQYINFGNIVNIGTSQIYIFAVSQHNSTASGAVVGKTSFRGNPGRWAITRDTTAGGMTTLIDPNGAGTAPTFADSSTSARILTGYWDRSNVFIFENGTQRATAALSSSANLSNTDPLYVGAYPNNTGTGPQTGLFLNGRIGEVIVYLGSLTASQRQDVEGYLALKWDLTSVLPSTSPYATRGLPSTHPYKKISPI